MKCIEYVSNVFFLADPVSHSGKLMEAFETLSKRLRLLDDIPLKVSTVQPLDPGIFYFQVLYWISLPL